MCSIVGTLITEPRETVVKMLEAMKHRGPDGTVIVTHGRFWIGASRLAITDPSAADTAPLCDERYTLAFNGEIYNAPELRKKLKSYTFRTKTDTEVLLAAWKEWGEDALDRIKGMFAFAISDGEDLWLYRDQSGEKPLYVYADGERVAFASELKGITAVFEGTAQMVGEDFENLEYWRTETPFVHIFQVPAGHFYKIKKDFPVPQLKRWWVPKKIRIDSEPDKQLEKILERVMETMIPRDVPFGLYASGGVDSELIRSFLPKDTPCFTFKEDDDHEKRFLEELPRVVHHLDTPVGSYSPYGLWWLAGEAKKAGCKVVFSGEGADELFAGYARQIILGRLLQIGGDLPEYAPLISKLGTPSSWYGRMVNRAPGVLWPTLGSNPLFDSCFYEHEYLLPMLLQMGDRMAMAHGLENRCPFLHPDVINFAFSLRDDNWRVGHGDKLGKKILRTILERRVPGSPALSMPKKGLYVPVNKWLGLDAKITDRKPWLAKQYESYHTSHGTGV